MPDKTTWVDEAVLQITWFIGTFTTGVGFTVIVKFCCAPGQVIPPAVYSAVTVTPAIIGAAVLFNALNAVMFPIPFVPKPIIVLLFVQT